MIELSQTEIDKLTDMYLVANTPSYLYRRFRDSVIVERVAKDSTAEQLLETIRTVDKLEDRELLEVVKAYTATVALTFLDPRAFQEALGKIEIVHLEWVLPILSLWHETQVPISTHSVLYKPPLSVDAIIITTPTSTTSHRAYITEPEKTSSSASVTDVTVTGDDQ